MCNFLKLKALLILVCSLAGCGGYSATGGVGKVVQPRLRSELVAGVDLGEINSVLVAPLLFSDAILKSSEHNLVGRYPFYELVSRTVESKLSAEVFSGTDVVSRLAPGGGIRVDETQFFSVADAVGARGVLITRVHRYVERVGSRVGVEQPASVYFTMELLRTDSRDLVWRSSYSFTDRALSENLFRLKDHFGDRTQPGWRTASDALLRGISEATEDLNHKYSRQFLNVDDSIS